MEAVVEATKSHSKASVSGERSERSKASANTAAPTVDISIGELVQLAAVDSEFFGRYFFPSAFRNASPDFAPRVWDLLENPEKTYVNLIIFRGSSKTTRMRVFLAKRIAYGISRTILLLGPSDKHAIHSLGWLRAQVEKNKLWAQTFHLKPGRKWEEMTIEIVQELPGEAPVSIWVIASGIFGSVRGFNLEDRRPDFIAIDDVIKDEEALSEVQLNKLVDQILGAVKNSLAPEIDEPNRKLVIAHTPQQKGDPSDVLEQHPEFATMRVGCWTEATTDLPVDQQVSCWEERHPTGTLRAEKKAAIATNRLSIFTREKECRITSRETAIFRSAWLRVRPEGVVVPRGAYTIIGIDPVPPPSEAQLRTGLRTKDDEVIQAWSRWRGEYHLRDSRAHKGHDPSWTIANVFEMALEYGAAKIVIESVAYQRTLKWILEQEMMRRRIYYVVVPYVDNRKKFVRIDTTLNPLATHGLLWVGMEHSRFIERFEKYGPGVEEDDDLDCAAITLSELSSPALERLDGDGGDGGANDNDDVEQFPFAKVCP